MMKRLSIEGREEYEKLYEEYQKLYASYSSLVDDFLKLSSLYEELANGEAGL